MLLPFVTKWTRRTAEGKGTANTATQKFAHGVGMEGRTYVPCKTFLTYGFLPPSLPHHFSFKDVTPSVILFSRRETSWPSLQPSDSSALQGLCSQITVFCLNVPAESN